MGSAKRQRKKFSGPSHPWQKERILLEKDLQKEYGLKRKYEIWKMNSILKNFTRQAKNLVTIRNKQVEKERGQLLNKLYSLGLINKEAKIEDILSLTLKNIMERRLQTLVYRKNLASTIDQSRQFIVHEHIALGDKTVTSPSYLVPVEEETIIKFAVNSSLVDANHPLRAAKAEKEQKQEKQKEERRKAREDARKELGKVSGTAKEISGIPTHSIDKTPNPKEETHPKTNTRAKNAGKQKDARKSEIPENKVSGTNSGKEEKTEVEAKA